MPPATNFNPEINLREVSANGSYWEDGHWLLLRVGKAAEALKFNVFHKFRKLGEFLLRLARETRNKRCAQRHARNLLADLLHQRRQALTVSGAVHAL